MPHLIDKDALVAEIDKKLSYYKDLESRGLLSKEGDAAFREVRILKSDINSLEVKEVDLEKELIEWHKEHFKKDGTFIGMSGFYLTNNSQMDIAKHFFELGVNASNPLTWEDVRLLDLLCCKVDMNCDLEEKEHYEEVLKRFKALKGEKI